MKKLLEWLMAFWALALAVPAQGADLVQKHPSQYSQTNHLMPGDIVFVGVWLNTAKENVEGWKYSDLTNQLAQDLSPFFPGGGVNGHFVTDFSGKATSATFYATTTIPNNGSLLVQPGAGITVVGDDPSVRGEILLHGTNSFIRFDEGAGIQNSTATRTWFFNKFTITPDNVASLKDIGGSNYANVTWYGAKGDGVTDDTLSIQTAINSNSANSTIYFPAGTYKLTSAITNYGLRDVKMLGVGSGTSVGVAGNKATVFACYLASNNIPWLIDRCNGGLYQNLHWDCFTTNTPIALVSIDQTGPAGWGTMTDCEFNRCTFQSIHTNLNQQFKCVMLSSNSTQNCEQMRFNDCYFRGFGLDWFPATNNSIGIWIGNNANALDIQVRGGSFNNFSAGILASSGSLSARHLFMNDNATNVVIKSASGPMEFEDIRSETERQEFWILGSTAPISILNCTFQDTTGWNTNCPLLRFDGSTPLIFRNNTFTRAWGQTNFLVTVGSVTFDGTGNTFTTNDFFVSGINQLSGDAHDNVQLPGHILLGTATQFISSGRTNFTFAQSVTNFTTQFVNLIPEDNIALHIGGTGGGLPDTSGPGGVKLSLWGGALPLGFTIGDSTVNRRFALISGGNANDSVANVFANGTAQMNVQVGAEYVRLETFAGHPGFAGTLPMPYRDRNGTEFAKWGLDGSFNVYSNAIFQAGFTAGTNSFIGGSLSVTGAVNIYGTLPAGDSLFGTNGNYFRWEADKDQTTNTVGRLLTNAVTGIMQWLNIGGNTGQVQTIAGSAGQVLTAKADGSSAWSNSVAGGSQTPWGSDINGAGFQATNIQSIGLGGPGEATAKNASALVWGTNTSGQFVVFRQASSNSLFRLDSSVNGAAYGAALSYDTTGNLSVNNAVSTVNGSITSGNNFIVNTGGAYFAGSGGGNNVKMSGLADGEVTFFGASASADFFKIRFGGATATNGQIRFLSSGLVNPRFELRDGATTAWLDLGLGNLTVATNVWVTNTLNAIGNQTNTGWLNVLGGQTNWGPRQVIGQSDLASVTNRGGFTNGGRFVNLSAFQFQTNTPALTGSGTTNFIIDCSLGNVFNLFPTANFKLWLTNAYSGFEGWINVVQDGSGSRLWVYDASNIRTNASLVLSTAANSVDRIDMRSDTKGTNVQFTLQKNFQ